MVDTTPQPTASVIITPTPTIQTPTPELSNDVVSGGGNEGGGTIGGGGGGSINANPGMNYLNDAIINDMTIFNDENISKIKYDRKTYMNLWKLFIGNNYNNSVIIF